jgi:hypothetical protein
MPQSFIGVLFIKGTGKTKLYPHFIAFNLYTVFTSHFIMYFLLLFSFLFNPLKPNDL